MTNQEAIERLQRCKRNLELGKVIGAVSEEGADERIEAYDLAIKALEDEPQGEGKLYNFVSSPTEVIKVGEPIPYSDEINKALEKGKLYQQGFEDAMRKFKRPQGKWVLDSIGCYCSECKKYPDATTDYCPFCGAQMFEAGK